MCSIAFRRVALQQTIYGVVNPFVPYILWVRRKPDGGRSEAGTANAGCWIERQPPTSKREDFLLAMYREMWSNINRHIGVIWNSVTVLFSAFAFLSFVERRLLPIEYASTLLIIVVSWQLAHVYDASYWFNRNLLIIKNIERQFLGRPDLHDIHFYFGRDRGNKLMEHFQIQFGLGLTVGILVLTYHWLNQGPPSSINFRAEWPRALPYLAAVLGVICIAVLRHSQAHSYERLRENSPGRQIP